MLQDVFFEDKRYPCTDISADKLSLSVEGVSSGDSSVSGDLLSGTCPIALDQIPWDQIRYLEILGAESGFCNGYLATLGFKPGAYINHKGDWLLLVHPGERTIRACMQRSASTLVSFALFHTAISSLYLGFLLCLKRLIVQNNHMLKKVHGLDMLTQLTCLDFSKCSYVAVLPGLDKLTQLTSLNLSLCKKLYALPDMDMLTQLTYLDLSGTSIKRIPDSIRKLKNLRI